MQLNHSGPPTTALNAMTLLFRRSGYRIQFRDWPKGCLRQQPTYFHSVKVYTDERFLTCTSSPEMDAA